MTLSIRLFDEDLEPASELGSQWEQLVVSSPASGFMQSLHWSKMKRSQGLRSKHFGLFQDDVLVGGAIFYMTRRISGAGILVAPEGPIIPWRDDQAARQQLGLLMATIEQQAAEDGVMGIRVEPRIPAPQPAILRGFRRAPADLVPRETLILNLQNSEELLLAGMKGKGRYNIRLAERRGVTVSEHLTVDALDQFYEAVAQASERDDFALESPQFFAKLLQTLIPAGMARVFLAHHDRDLLGGLLMVTYGDRATYLYGGVTNAKRNLMAGYALQWAAIKAAQSHGCKSYDFYGYVPHRAAEHAYGRFSQFKHQFGGQSVRYVGGQDYYFLDNVANVFVKAASEIAKHNASTTPEAVSTR